MAHIQIQREHTLDHKEARNAAEHVAEELNKAHSISYHWVGDTLHFERTGIRGLIHVRADSVYVEATLGLVMRPMRGLFENEIQRRLDKIISTA
jgi:putative polyhydroxyalkanoate system protein